MIVLAKQKPLEEQPKWNLCCEEGIQALQRIANIIYRVDLEESFTSTLKCCFCNRLVSDVRAYRVVGLGQYGVPVDCFDFDEGEHVDSTVSHQQA